MAITIIIIASGNIASPTFSFSLNTLKDVFKVKLADLQSHNFLFFQDDNDLI